ncbi:MAG: ABC transporter ATP-binding protein [Verrucomicrobia bacterium]|nr:ABC transporter ATP-binding protein [Verrucomicrobiota bacterium]
MSLVHVRNASKTYPLGDTLIEALKGVDLTISEAEFVAIWGPSGSGKSTLCHLIGVIDQPTSGWVEFDGVDVLSLSDDARSDLRNRKIGFVFQNFNLVPVLSALENVQLPLQMQGIPDAESRKLAMEMLVKVGLEDHAGHWPKKLSGGQRQRVAIARALINRPAVIVADEPTANLDSENAQKIIDLMRTLNREFRTSFVFSTHDERLLASVDRKVHLLDGLITEDVKITAK